MKLVGAVVLVIAAAGCGGKGGAAPARPQGHEVAKETAPEHTASEPATPSDDAAPSDPVAVDAPPVTSGTFEFEGTVLGSAIAGGTITPVSPDPRFVLTVRIDSVGGGGQGQLRAGETRRFGIHSPSMMFPFGVPTGQRTKFTISWSSSGTSKRFSALRQRR